ncbi:MAG: RIP metalloprotease RseP [Deltaproteobacteria bacterium]|nr:RIP metalloprotease RseP [Deltaproteobacteria bacterium]
MEIILNFLFQLGHIIFYYLLPFVVVLGIMIFFHELGHFLIAKYFDVKVLKFSLGFGPKILAKKVGETEYSIRYFPLGGFVKMLGEDEEDEESFDIAPEDEERAFNNKHPLKRIAIVAAGPVFNLILAFFLFCGLYLISGKYVMTTEIGQITPDSPAAKAGISPGDIVISVQGIKVSKWEELKSIVQRSTDQPLALAVEREGEIIRFEIIPEVAMVKNEFGEEIKSALIGIVAAGKFIKVEIGPIQSVHESLSETWRWIKLTCLVVVKLFQGVISIKTVGGPILIGQMTGNLVQENISYLIPFMAIISINLGILNLFPIPILDGGVIIFLLIELIMRKPLSIRKREIAQKVGLSLLIILMVIVFYNDILRIIE